MISKCRRWFWRRSNSFYADVYKLSSGIRKIENVMKNAVILFLLLCELMMSCLNPNCETNSKAAREKECLLILEKEPYPVI
jgi:hypothetical protein